MNQRQGIRGEKGITLLTLVITVALMVILTAAMVNNSSTSFHLSKLTKLQNDIEMLNDRGRILLCKRRKANMSDLNYGNKWNSTSSAETDKYIINGKTHIVYYVQGINFEGEMYHTVGKNI